MDIVMLDGFLTALVVGPDLVPPSGWLPVVWGGRQEPVFESAAQAQDVFMLMMHRFEAISSALALDPPEFEPLLYVRQVSRDLERRRLVLGLPGRSQTGERRLAGLG